jgi:hypothetical protein
MAWRLFCGCWRDGLKVGIDLELPVFSAKAAIEA